MLMNDRFIDGIFFSVMRISKIIVFKRLKSDIVLHSALEYERDAEN